MTTPERFKMDVEALADQWPEQRDSVRMMLWTGAAMLLTARMNAGTEGHMISLEDIGVIIAEAKRLVEAMPKMEG